MTFQDCVGVSGGKDSDCVAGLADERQQRTGRAALFHFSDTCHEHDWTYEHIERLERVLGISIRRIKRDFGPEIARRRDRLPTQWREAGVPENLIDDALALLQPTGIAYLDMVLAKGMFAAGVRRKFCTEELKIQPADKQIIAPLIEADITPVSWLGIRADESKKRANDALHPRFKKLGTFSPPHIKWSQLLYRPILAWSVDDVIAYHKHRGIPLNPLYAEGFTRVGCFPCINERKASIAIIARRFPEAIEKLRVWEDLCTRVNVSRRFKGRLDEVSTFFPSGTVPGIDRNAIDDVVAWSRTDGGTKRQTRLFAGFTPSEMGLSQALADAAEEDRTEDQGFYACTAGMGYCE